MEAAAAASGMSREFNDFFHLSTNFLLTQNFCLIIGQLMFASKNSHSLSEHQWNFCQNLPRKLGSKVFSDYHFLWTFHVSAFVGNFLSFILSFYAMSDYIESKGMVCCRWRGDYRGKKGHRRPAKGKKKRILIERALRRDGYYRGASECRRRREQ